MDRTRVVSFGRLGGIALLLFAVTGCATLGGATRFGRPISQPTSPPATISLEPTEATNPIRTQHTVKATVKDANGKGVHSTLVEWTLARTPGAVGDIIEPGQDPLNRALKIDNTYAITGTDDKGESWISITSVQEGITHIIAYVSDIKDGSKHKAFAIKNWLDAKWTFPPAATNKVGTKHAMATRVVRESDGTPLEGYEVRWQVASGPPAVFEESKKAEAVTKTGEDGVARATLVQTSPAAGVNSVTITISKLRDPGRACCPTPYGLIARGSAMKTWVAPTLTIQKTCPASIVKGDTGEFSFVVTNSSQVEATDVVVKDTLPAGFTHVASTPEAKSEGGTLSWSLGPLSGGASRTVTMRLKPSRTGQFTNEVTASAREVAPVRAACNTVVTEAAISIAKTCPAEGLVGDSLNYQATVRNPGTAPVQNVVVTDTVPVGMRHASGQREVVWRAGTMAPGASASQTFTFVAEKTGTATNVVSVEAGSGLSDQAKCQTVIRQPGIGIKKSGRERQVTGRTVTYTIAVSNPGTAPATGVVVSDQIPVGMSYVSSNPSGAYNAATRTVSWSLGTLAAGAKATIEVVLKGDAEGRFCDTATVTAERNLSDRAQACTLFEGVPGVLIELVDNPDPVEIGTTTLYTITVTNQGSTPITNLKVVARVPAGEAYVSHVGATTGTPEGQTVTFAPYPTLPPGQKFTHTVTIRGVGIAGQDQSDVRFTVELTADQLVRPVIREESTHIYR